MTAQELKAFLAQTHLHQSGLRGMQRQTQVVHDLAHLFQRRLGLCLCTAEDDEVIRIPHQLAQVRMRRCPRAIQFIEVDVGQER